MKIPTESYLVQKQRWPQNGRHILAHFDADTIVVYQAYRPAIGLYAARHGHFGGEFSLDRMSWIKPNFLWMMYRSGWGTKEGQEITLAVHLQRRAFDEILAAAVPSSFDPERYPDRNAWSQAVSASHVRLQWDPDHDPFGVPQQRRALQLGLRGETLRRYAREWIVEIEDLSDFVARQAAILKSNPARLETPQEEVYPPNHMN